MLEINKVIDEVLRMERSSLEVQIYQRMMSECAVETENGLSFPTGFQRQSLIDTARSLAGLNVFQSVKK